MDNSLLTSPISPEYPGEPSFMEFGGWNMPRDFKGIIAEHNSVREKAGLFDLSHMGRFIIRGKNCAVRLGSLFTRSISAAEDGKALYGFFLDEKGRCLDDLIIYRRSEEECWLVVNAANRKKVYDWLENKLEKQVLEDVTKNTVLLALQGPKAPGICAKYGLQLPDKPFRAEWTGEGMISTTGYTGEKGGEFWLTAEKGGELYCRLLDKVQPCGLGARDSLRLEKGFPLYGHELGEGIDPVQAGLDNFIDRNHDFIGKASLEKYRENPPDRVIKGFKLAGRRSPRPSSFIYYRGEESGKVTSASYCPTLERAGGMALIDRNIKEDAEIQVEISGKLTPAIVSSLPLV